PGRSPVRSHGATPYPYPCPLDRYLQAADRGRTPDPLDSGAVDVPADLLARLRDRLLATGYTIDGVRDRLGDVAAAALAREQLVPAERATRAPDPLGALIRLWWLG